MNKNLLTAIAIFGYMFLAFNSVNAQTPFTCSNTIFHTKGPNTNVQLYTYNLASGTTGPTLVSFSGIANALVYNPTDNMLWVMYSQWTAGAPSALPVLQRIDALGNVVTMTVPNLSSVFNTNTINPTAGGVTNDGYYLVKRASSVSVPLGYDYAVIDINPSRATYLQLVDPQNNYAVATAPYYKSTTTLIGVADFAYKVSDGLFYGITTAGKIGTLDINTNTYTEGISITVGGSIPPSQTYGSIFTDATGFLYSILNNGDAYSIALPSGIATLLSSTGVSVTNTDGANCPINTNVLPLNWLSIKGNINTQQQAQLTWQVNETSVSHYVIEKSNDGRLFTNIITMQGKGNGTNTYSFTDAVSLTGTAYYRIKQIDINGRYSYSSIVSLSNKSLVKASIYPNPVKGSATISVDKDLLRTTATLTNMAGQPLQMIKINSQTFTIDVSNYSSGIYLLKLENGELVKVVKE